MSRNGSHSLGLSGKRSCFVIRLTKCGTSRMTLSENKWYYEIISASILRLTAYSQGKGVAKPSLTTDILEAKPDRTPEEDTTYRWLTATIYAGEQLLCAK